MANTRFKGGTASERLSLTELSDSDMFQVRHRPETVHDSDKGVSKALLQSVPVGVCTTPAAAAAKTADLSGDSFPDFTLVSGREVLVYFTAGNNVAAPTLNFAGTGTIPLTVMEGKSVHPFAAGTWLHLKYVDVTISDTRHQKWLIMGSNYAEQDHNVPRWINGVLGKDITSYYNDGTLWKRLNGTDGFTLFEDIYAGDYFKMSRAITSPKQSSQYAVTGSQWVTIAGINSLKCCGYEISIDYNHLVMIPGKGEEGSFHFGRNRMYSANTITGGYKGSEINTDIIGAVVSSGSIAAGATVNQQLYAEFGSHLKTTRELISNTVTASLYNRLGSATGASSNWNWEYMQAVFMSEVEVFGAPIWSSSGYDTGTACMRLPLFMYSRKAINNQSSYYWLKDVASVANFCIVNLYGGALYSYANSADNYVRPRFVLGA